MIVQKAVRRLLRAEVFDWVGPEDVAHQAGGWRFAETVELREGRSVSVSIGNMCVVVVRSDGGLVA